MLRFFHFHFLCNSYYCGFLPCLSRRIWALVGANRWFQLPVNNVERFNRYFFPSSTGSVRFSDWIRTSNGPDQFHRLTFFVGYSQDWSFFLPLRYGLKWSLRTLYSNSGGVFSAFLVSSMVADGFFSVCWEPYIWYSDTAFTNSTWFDLKILNTTTCT